MAENSKLNLLIVEDHALTLFGLKTVLSSKDFVNEIFDIIRQVKADGTTVLLVEQNAKKALAILSTYFSPL